MLRFIYTDKPSGEQGKLPGWLMRQLAEGTDEIFEIADRFLVVALKVKFKTSNHMDREVGHSCDRYVNEGTISRDDILLTGVRLYCCTLT